MSDQRAPEETPSQAARLDQALVARGLFPSRMRAQAAIRAGLVRIDGVVATAPSASVAPGASVVADGDVHDYVSRGGVKLAAGLDAFAVEAADRICLDLGASTGGFTEALLRRGAARVYAVDVGRDQLHPRIASDPRVVRLEGMAARDLAADVVPEPPAVIVADVSFISLRKALPHALALAAPAARLVALVKPQFEMGRKALGKGGLVVAPQAEIDAMLTNVAAWIGNQGWRVDGVIDSPIAGGGGAKEHLLGATRIP